MLSEHTAKQLASICSKSGELYEQGGMSYSYSYSHLLSHTLASTGADLYDAKQFDKVKMFFEKATVGFGRSSISEETESLLNTLLSNFHKDFYGSEHYLQSFKDSGHSIEMNFIFSNTTGFHKLEFFWSLD